MSEPVVAGVKPAYYELEKGRSYLWCACGLSKRQPFCDGSHTGTGIEPVRYTAEADGEEVLFCMCKRTSNGPHCDGAHNALPGAYVEDDPDSPANRRIPEIGFTEGAIAPLDHGCYVYSRDRADYAEVGALRYAKVITPSLGARHQSQFYCEVDGSGPLVSVGDREAVLFVASGRGRAEIAGEPFELDADTGVYIRRGEAFRLIGDGRLSVYVSACPAADDLEFPAELAQAFDRSQPERRVPIDPAKRQAMAARFFQMLVDKSVGSTVVTQFVGHIPKSKAAMHRHLYEEALIILRGEGMMWTESRKAPVKAGDVIFFPRKAAHSLESTSETGMDVVGVIYPGDNPSINY